jgi:hypothetical protein
MVEAKQQVKVPAKIETEIDANAKVESAASMKAAIEAKEKALGSAGVAELNGLRAEE